MVKVTRDRTSVGATAETRVGLAAMTRIWVVKEVEAEAVTFEVVGVGDGGRCAARKVRGKGPLHGCPDGLAFGCRNGNNHCCIKIPNEYMDIVPV